MAPAPTQNPLTTTDLTIIGVYLFIIVCVGLWNGLSASFRAAILRAVCRRPDTAGGDHYAAAGGDAGDAADGASTTNAPPPTASADEEYFLGGRAIPWWAIAASGMSSNLDVSGTMINTAFVYAIGASGIFAEIRGGFGLSMAFTAVFMGKWHARAKVMTVAEWMELRFGTGRAGAVARICTAVASLVSAVGSVAYFALGTGKFAADFLGMTPFGASCLVVAAATAYTVFAGLQGVVWTDVFQSGLVFATIFAVVRQAWVQVDMAALPDMLTLGVPVPRADAQNEAISFEAALARNVTREAWESITPSAKLAFPEESNFAPFNNYWLVMVLYGARTTLVGLGGPTGYGAQRFFSIQNDKDAARTGFLWVSLLCFRWVFIMAIALLALNHSAQTRTTIDPELIIPFVIEKLLPSPLRGVLVAGLLAAAMSTFDSVVNAGASYWVKDIYLAFLRPGAPEASIMRHSRGASVAVVVFGLFASQLFSNINEIWGLLTMGITGGMLLPLFLRWYCPSKFCRTTHVQIERSTFHSATASMLILAECALRCFDRVAAQRLRLQRRHGRRAGRRHRD